MSEVKLPMFLFKMVRVGESSVPFTLYLARSPEEYKEFGGVLAPGEHPMTRGLPCVIDKIDRETGVVDLTTLSGYMASSKRVKSLRDVEFKIPAEPWPYESEPGGTWHFLRC